MNDEYDTSNDMKWERYRAYLQSLSFEELVMYFDNMTKEQLIGIIQDTDPNGKQDGCYEG